GLVGPRAPRTRLARPALGRALARGAGDLPGAAVRPRGPAATTPGGRAGPPAGPDRPGPPVDPDPARARPARPHPGGPGPAPARPSPRARPRRGGRPLVHAGGPPGPVPALRLAAAVVARGADAARPGVPRRPPRGLEVRPTGVVRRVAAGDRLD